MNKYWIIGTLVFLLTIQSSLALTSHWDCEDDLVDTIAGNNLTSYLGTTLYSTDVPSFNHTGGGGSKSCDFDTNAAYAEFAGGVYNYHQFTINLWAKDDDHIGSYLTVISLDPNSGQRSGVFLSTNSGNGLSFNYAESASVKKEVLWDYGSTALWDSDTWLMVTSVKNATGIYVYLNGTLKAHLNTTSNVHYDVNHIGFGGYNNDGTRTHYSPKRMDEMRFWSTPLSQQNITNLFNCGTATPCSPTPTPTVTNNSESAFITKQVGTTTLSLNNTNATIISQIITANETNQFYGDVTLQMFSTTDVTATCTIEGDGTPIATSTRTNLANTIGSMVVSTEVLNLSIGANTLELICQKNGDSDLIIGLATGIGHVMDNTTLLLIDTITNNSVTLNNQSIRTDNLTIPYSGNVIIEWNNQISNNQAKQTITTQLITSEGSCGTFNRTIEAGYTGSTGGVCAFYVTNGTNFTAGLYTTGTNINITHKPILKILTTPTNYSKIPTTTGIGTTPTLLGNITLNNTLGLDKAFMKAGISIKDSGQTANFYFTINGNDTTIIPKTASGNTEVLITQELENAPSGVFTVQLYGYSNTGTFDITGGDFISYTTKDYVTNNTFFEIEAKNWWNGTYLNNFEATYNGITVNTTTGTIKIFTLNETFLNITLSSKGYYNKTILNHNTSNNITVQLYTTKTSIQATEINTGNSILKWSLITGNGTYNTTNGTVSFHPNQGTYTWDWKNSESYFNISNLGFTISTPQQTLTIQNLYARNISFQDNISTLKITPSCTQDGYTYNSYDYLMPKSTNNIICQLFGYETRTISTTSFPDNSTYKLQPVGLGITFSEKVYGILQAGGETPELVNQGVYTIDEFNSTNITVPQKNISEGYVKITFNPDANGKFQQIYSYYNDLNTTIKENILVQTVDLVQEIRVTGNTQAIENARVCAKYPNNETYETTYCDFTGTTGDVNIQVDDQHTYLFCVQATGWEPTCELHYIPPSNQELITINLAGTTVNAGSNYITSTCAPVYTQDKSCLLDVTTYKPFYSICLNNTKTIGATTTSSLTCIYDSMGETFIYTLNQSYDYYNISIFLNGNLTQTFLHYNSTDTASEQINFRTGNQTATGETIRQALTGNLPLLIFIHFVLVVLGIIAGYMLEKYYNNYGVYGSGIWFLFVSLGGFYIFWIPTIVIITYFITEKALPMFSN